MIAVFLEPFRHDPFFDKLVHMAQMRTVFDCVVVQ